MSDTTTAEDRWRGVLIGLAAGDQIGEPIRMGLGLAKSLPGTRQIFSEKIYLRVPGGWETGRIFFNKICRPSRPGCSKAKGSAYVTVPPLTLLLGEGTFAMSRLGRDAAVPSWATAGVVSSITRTPDEISVVCAEEAVPDGVRHFLEGKESMLVGIAFCWLCCPILNLPN